ncbi:MULTISPECIES: hypothetical protein [unclassified Kaistella]|uniref:hypothetical protein n=1 Tax=unclassified Kaistella TaxID=2762626 RepID=UPI00273373E1|nr:MULTISPECIES: hypothetical protein [unclassified Kaistella]MDP2454615.1 hypothetical protein [Kaistella sp. SH11-4b]MDP2457352.1 hypothetical protein [Kaistella sp. SH40-3]MDP2460112.1 hypothetical protein [Kaistella sp. SH19-2b]
MVGEINYSPLFIDELDDLAKVLYQQKYFSFVEDVDIYIDKIYDFIESKIEYPISKNSPESFDKFGKKYLRYKANNQTFWYIFFDQKDNQFIINHILNNHSQDFPELL